MWTFTYGTYPPIIMWATGILYFRGIHTYIYTSIRK